jgi:hypothetical protein
MPACLPACRAHPAAAAASPPVHILSSKPCHRCAEGASARPRARLRRPPRHRAPGAAVSVRAAALARGRGGAAHRPGRVPQLVPDGRSRHATLAQPQRAVATRGQGAPASRAAQVVTPPTTTTAAAAAAGGQRCGHGHERRCCRPKPTQRQLTDTTTTFTTTTGGSRRSNTSSTTNNNNINALFCVVRGRLAPALSTADYTTVAAETLLHQLMRFF